MVGQTNNNNNKYHINDIHLISITMYLGIITTHINDVKYSLNMSLQSKMISSTGEEEIISFPK